MSQSSSLLIVLKRLRHSKFGKGLEQFIQWYISLALYVHFRIKWLVEGVLDNRKREKVAPWECMLHGYKTCVYYWPEDSRFKTSRTNKIQWTCLQTKNKSHVCKKKDCKDYIYDPVKRSD
jgi:hypothetical protein